MPAGKLGRLPRKHNPKTLFMARYSQGAVPPPPSKVYYEYLVKQWPMYGNDQLGDCVFACGGHMLQNWTAHGSVEISPTDDEILSAYEAVGGYKPGDPSTDNGAAITDFLNWWQANPLGGKTISAWASIDPANLTAIKQAIWIFGGIDIGINVPSSAMDQFNAGQNWEYVPKSAIEGRHSICVFGYGTHGCACITWRRIQYMSWEFFSAYCDEAYAIITPDWLKADGKTEFGLDLATLQSDLEAIRS